MRPGDCSGKHEKMTERIKMGRLTDQDKQKIDLMLANHVPKACIARVIGINRRNLYRYLARKDLDRNGNESKRKRTEDGNC